MPPKKNTASSPSKPAAKQAPARGTLQHLWANAPKHKPAPQPKQKISRELMTLEVHDAADAEKNEQTRRLRGRELGKLSGQLDGVDPKDSVMLNARSEIEKNRDGTPKLGSVSPVRKKPLTHGERTKELGAQKEKAAKGERKKGLVAESGELKCEDKSPSENARLVPELKGGKRGASRSKVAQRMAKVDVGPQMDEVSQPGRRSLRKHATLVSEMPSPRKLTRNMDANNNIEADYDTDEASSQGGRRSPRKHAGTPVPGSGAGTPRSGTPRVKDLNQKLKRAGSNLTKSLSKTRRTISPERKVRFSGQTSAPEKSVMRPDEEKTPIVEIPAYDPEANFHKALISPPKKGRKPPGNSKSRSGTSLRQSQSPAVAAKIAAAFLTPTKAGRRSTSPSRQSPSIAANTASASKAEPAVQNGSPLKKVGKRARRLSATAGSPGRGKRSRSSTPRTTPAEPARPAREYDDSVLSELGATPPHVEKASPIGKNSPSNNATPSKKDKRSSLLLSLEDTPSPPASLTFEQPVHGPSFTNGKSSQSHRTVVEDTDAESSDDSDDDLPMVFHKAHAIASIPRVSSHAKPAATDRKGVVPNPGKERKYKFSLKNLVASMEDNERTNETAAKVTKMMAEKDALLKNPSKNGKWRATPHDFHAKLLEDVVQQTAEAAGDNAQKVLKALKRANVTQGVELVYHFFETAEHKKMKNKKQYPKYLLDLLDKEGPNKLWHEMFGNRETREMGLRDGLFANMVAVDQGMEEGMFYWVLDQLAKERNETLRYGYLQMLLNAPISIIGHFTSDTVRIHFKTLGAKKEALAMDKEMAAEPAQKNSYQEFAKADHWGGLIYFLELLGRTAVLLSDETREYALNVILRLCADKVARNITIQEATQKALMLLSEAFETEELWEEVSTRLSQILYTTIPSTHLLLHTLSSIPSRPRLHKFRRRLAYAYFLQNPSLLEDEIQSTFSIDHLTRHLETKNFQTSRDTKDSTYARLDSDIKLLDIALDCGSSSTAPKLGIRHLNYAFVAVGAATGTDYEANLLKIPAQDKEKEKIFNEQCDALAKRLNIVLNGIQDLGPGHAERSECRATIAGVRNRVECCVRTFVKQNVRRIGDEERLGDGREERELRRGKKFLAGFLRKGENGGERDLDAEAEAQILMRRYT